ncbi:hypothetical protein OB905_05520 [Halobacteria archaeon AArc-dxtr1]|nr:hypothetical protein [Halobacteria archaeon AArc-dxtr1]
MSETNVAPRIQLVDRWSWLVAMAVTIALFLTSVWLTADVQFSAVAGAGAGIGVQYLLPYQARRTVPGGDADVPDGPIHQGAAGGALVLAAPAAVAALALGLGSTPSLGVGGLVLVASYALLSTVLDES